MAGNAITGRDGDGRLGAVQICELTKWMFNPKVNIVAYASNKTAGAKQKLVGVKEGTGTLEGVWDPANPAYSQLTEGLTGLVLKLYVNATQFWQITAVIESFSNDVNIDAGELVHWTANFHAQGTWTAPVAALMMPEMGMPEGIVDPLSPTLVPAGPLMQEGDTFQTAMARHQAMMEKVKLPETLEELVKLVSARVERLKTPEGMEEMIERSAERVAVKLTDGIVSTVADKVLYVLKDRLPPYQAAA